MTTESMDNLPEILSVRQVSEFLGMAENSVYSAVRQGELPARRLGRRVLISKVAFARWLHGDETTMPGNGKDRE